MLAIITRFRDFFDEPFFPVEQIKQAHLRSFVQSLKRENPKLRGSSINTYLNMNNALLHSAERNFPELETWKPPRMPFESVPEEGRERLITEEEQARIFFELRAPRGQVGTRHRRIEKIEEVRARHTVADLLDFALLTGMRNTEARTLNSSKIDWIVRTIRDDRSGQEVTVYGEIALTTTKTGKKRKVPLNRDARELLERRSAESQSEWLFPNTAGTRPMSETVVRRMASSFTTRATRRPPTCSRAGRT
jgi:integrase